MEWLLKKKILIWGINNKNKDFKWWDIEMSGQCENNFKDTIQKKYTFSSTSGNKYHNLFKEKKISRLLFSFISI